MPDATDETGAPERTKAIVRSANNAIKSLQSKLDEWMNLGGSRVAVEQARVTAAELRGAAEGLTNLLPELEAASAASERAESEQLFRVFQQIAKRHNLPFEGQLQPEANRPLTLKVGVYDLEIKPRKGAAVSFVGQHLGTMRELDAEKAFAHFIEIRRLTETQTKDFLKNLDRAYDAVTQGGKKEARVADVLRRFIMVIQPPAFWVDAHPKTLKTYTHANFAWEILQGIERGEFPYKFASANVHANIAAAGQRAKDGGLVLLLQPNGPPRLYSTMARAPKGG